MNSLNFTNNLIEIQSELLSYAYRLTNNREEANDLLQETSLKALKNENKYTTHINFKQWMCTIMHNLFINNYRKMVNNIIDYDSFNDLYHIDRPDESYNDRTYDLQELNRAIHTLSQDEQHILLLFASGVKYKDIAQKMNIPVGTVKSKLYNSRSKVLKDLKELY